MPNMRSLSLRGYLNADNKWTSRLLGLDKFSVTRTRDKILQEYDREKWGELAKHEFRDVEHAKEVEQEILMGPEWRTTETAISFKDEIFETTNELANLIYFDLLRKRFQKYQSARFCELGCGYGYNLSLFEGENYGGEYTESGVAVARKLGLDAARFDFNNVQSYGLIRPDSVVFTVQALEQIPDSSKFLEGMRSQRAKISTVLHLEPSVLPTRRDLFGILRNRYLEINDYNRNLVGLLQQAPDVEVLEFDPDCIGAPPLNSLHFVAWRFK
jgi:hypothetical protein